MVINIVANTTTAATTSSNNISSNKKALIIAIGEYKGKLKSIDYCVNDGNEMINTLTKLGYNISNNQKLIGKVDSSILRKTIFSFFQDKSITANDTILFYFSGHGVPDDTGKVFLASSETDPEIPSMDGFSFDDLAYLFDKKCPSLRKVMILDCCYSGAAEIGKGVGNTDKDSETNETNKSKSIIDEKSSVIEQGEGKYLLAASQGYQEAYDLKESGHSIFTYFLLEGLKGHKEAVNDDGYITPETIGKFIHRKIVSLPSDRRPKQTPLSKGEASGEIILAEYSHLRKKEQKNDGSLISEGLQYFENGDNDSALKLFDQAIKINPKNSIVYNYKGDIFFRSQNYQEAIKSYDEALKINPNYVDVLKDKGLSLKKLEKYDEALDCFEKALEINPKASERWHDKGSILLKIGKYDEAIKCFERIVDIDPNNADAWLNKGTVLEELKQDEESLKCYQKVISIDPHNLSAKVRIDELLTKHQDPDKKKSTPFPIFQKSTIKLEEFNILMNEGSKLFFKNKFKEALQKFDDAILINPNSSYAFSHKSSILIQMGEYKNALDAVHEALKIDPNNADALFNKGYILAGGGRYEEAIEFYNKVTNVDFKNANAWYQKADCYRRIGRKQDAKDCLKIADDLKIR